MSHLRTLLATVGLAFSLLLGSCGGGETDADGRRFTLSAAAANVPAETQEELYQFFAIAFGAAPGVTYWGQLVEAAQAGMSVQRIVNVFTTKPQFTEVYPEAMSNDALRACWRASQRTTPNGPPLRSACATRSRWHGTSPRCCRSTPPTCPRCAP